MAGPFSFLSLAYRYAVVGASLDPAKYGNTVFMNLRRGGFDVVPVNPKIKEIDGVPAVATLGDVVPKPDVAVIVVPPPIGLLILEQVAAMEIEKVWFEPGAESDAIIARGKQLGLQLCVQQCIMVQRRHLGIGK